MFTDHGERQWPGREVHMAIGKEAEKGMQLTSSFFSVNSWKGTTCRLGVSSFPS